MKTSYLYTQTRKPSSEYILPRIYESLLYVLDEIPSVYPHPLDITDFMGKPPIRLGQVWIESLHQFKSWTWMMNVLMNY
jgi:hypothetical protein